MQPCSIKCLFKDIRSALILTSPFSVLSLSLFVVLEIARCKCAQPLHPFPFVAGLDSWLWSWLWDKVSQLEHLVPNTMFFFEYCLWANVLLQRVRSDCVLRTIDWQYHSIYCQSHCRLCIVKYSLVISITWDYSLKKATPVISFKDNWGSNVWGAFKLMLGRNTQSTQPLVNVLNCFCLYHKLLKLLYI
jgi:hypothetical protein